ncbi:MAG: F0F1 ATP synthase subunit B [Thainema sp.]
MGICLQTALLIDGFLAEAVEESGFGLNFDILETNLINLAIVIGVLFYFGRKLLGNILGERRSRLETAIREAEQRKQEAMSALAEQQQKLAQAQAEAKRILETAQKNAENAKAEVLAQSEKDLERLKTSAAQDLTSQQERIVAELRRRIATLALEKAESQLSDHLDDNVQQQLISHSIDRLGGM